MASAMMAPPLLHAQSATTASDNAARRFDIAAGPLAQVISQYASAAGVALSFDGAQTRGLTSAGVHGAYSVDAGFAAALAGSGLEAVRGAQGAYTLRALPAAGPVTTLPNVAVIGSTSAPADDGFVALRSSGGTKTNTPLIEIPQAISVVTRDEMDSRGVQNFNSAVAYTPGIRAIDYPGGQGAPDIYLRGFRAFNLFSTYRDGLRAGFNQYDIDIETYGLERIDVIKGPSSVLYGQIAPGGLVDMTTKRPTETPLHEIELQGGNFNRRQAAFDFSGPLDEDGKWLYRITGVGRESGTQVDHSPDDRVYLAPSLTWRPTDRTSVTVYASYQKSKRGGSEQSLPLTGTVKDNPAGRFPSDVFLGQPDLTHYTVENTSIGYDVEHRASDKWTVRQKARYMHANVDYISSGARNSAQLTDGRYYTFGMQDRPKGTDTFLIDTSVEGRLTTGALQHTVLTGVDYGYYSGRESRTNGTNGTIDIFNPVYTNTTTWNSFKTVDGKSQVYQTGLYAQDQLRYERWILTLGGRYDWATNKESDYLSDTSSKVNSEAFTGRTGLTYLLDNGVAPYASYSTSFQPASGTLAPSRGGGNFDPTKGKQYELGLKYQPPGSDSTYTASLFQLTQQNVTTADPLYSGYSVQDGEVRSRGLELEAKTALTSGLNVAASYTYLDSEITKDNANLATGVSKKGLRPASVPRHMAGLFVDYTQRTGPLAGVGVGAGVRYVGSSYNSPNTVKIGGYTLVDAVLRYDLGQLSSDLKGLRASLSATNLFNKRYFTPGFYDQSVFYGNRRAVVGTLSYRW
ncbi:TonB-dependent siderophore receptor [Bordetella sp. N]|uniref:TonB-dependent siderophore receptor n=1 Tax=Bordetella sp. N TaxID=1746199 RepID=UPI001E46F999|nr:TonB-dependent siderophore receptor [Bordetella sp. N]